MMVPTNLNPVLTHQFEAKAETSVDLRTGSRSLDIEFTSLNKGTAVDDELATLKTIRKRITHPRPL